MTLTGLRTEAEIWQYAVEAGCGLSGMSGAAAVEVLADGRPGVVAAVGPIGERLRRLPSSARAAITEWVAHGTSCYTVGNPTGSGFAGHQELRAAGVAAVIVVPVLVNGQPKGVLLVADQPLAAPTTSMVAALELLSIGVGGCLAKAAVVDLLHRQATRDGLTGLTGLHNRASFLTDTPAAPDRPGPAAGRPPRRALLRPRPLQGCERQPRARLR